MPRHALRTVARAPAVGAQGSHSARASTYARWCRRSGSNRRPAAYKAAALPLSYGGDGPDCTPAPRSSGLIQFMTNRIDLALVNQWRAARFDPCSNTGAIDSKSGRHPSSVPCFAELRAPVGLSTTRHRNASAKHMRRRLPVQVYRGRVFNFLATVSNWAWLTPERSIPLG